MHDPDGVRGSRESSPSDGEAVRDPSKPYVSANSVASPVDVCVTKVSEVCFPSQRIKKSTVQKEFCWVRPWDLSEDLFINNYFFVQEEDVVSCQDEVEQMVDTVICDVEELPEPQVSNLIVFFMFTLLLLLLLLLFLSLFLLLLLILLYFAIEELPLRWTN